ncbi:Heterokaryon incompatibility protein (HET) domain containing protein [Naviculisporaceae sp. PSN 640]
MTQQPHFLPFEDFLGPANSIPPYTILSHTWESNSEVSFKDLEKPDTSTYSKAGFHKIRNFVQLSHQRDGLEYYWVDTCCIDKSSSAELSEAINSMFRWYAGSAVCYVYLSDLEPRQAESDIPDLGHCRWLIRGWTLQELIAPRHVVFFDKEWNEIGDKHGLSEQLSSITGIPVELLRGEASLSEYSVAKRMSWASKRQTTRDEDIAYCLLGLFDITMHPLYGEGKKKAFRRLQRACIEQEGDPSIFAWTGDDETQLYAPILADSPYQFKDCGAISALLENTVHRNMTLTPRGVTNLVRCRHFPLHDDDGYRCVLDILCTNDDTGKRLGVCVRKIAGGTYCRYKPWMLAFLCVGQETNGPWGDNNRTFVEEATLATDFPPHFPFPARNKRRLQSLGQTISPNRPSGPLHPTLNDGIADPVLGNRHCALRLIVNQDPSFVPGCEQQKANRYYSVYRSRAYPRSHWDVHDRVMFSSASISKSWCVFFIHGLVDETAHTGVPVDIFVWCHVWNLSRPKIMLATLGGLKQDHVTELELKIRNLVFEEAARAHDSIMLEMGRVANLVKTVAKTSIPAFVEWESQRESRCWGPGVTMTRGSGHVRSTDEGNYADGDMKEEGKVQIRVAVELKMEKDPKICHNDVVSLYLRVESIQSSM